MNKYVKALRESCRKIELKNMRKCMIEAVASDGSLDTTTTTYGEILDKPVYLICALTDDSDFWWSSQNTLIAGDTGSTRGNLLGELKVFPTEEAARNYAINYIKTKGMPEFKAYWDIDDALGFELYTCPQTMTRASFDEFTKGDLNATIDSEDIIAFDSDWDNLKKIEL